MSFNDLKTSFKKVKSGGYICGHDYVRNTVSAIYRYLSVVSSNSGLTNRELLASQPFRKTEFYSKGTSFSGLERFELPYEIVKVQPFLEDFEFPEDFGKLLLVFSATIE